MPLSFASPAAALGFEHILREAIAHREFVANFDRLTGSNLLLTGAPMQVAVDLASGRTDADMRRFAAFVKDVIWDRLPPQLKPEPREPL